jgi:hypothetical protein
LALPSQAQWQRMASRAFTCTPHQSGLNYEPRIFFFFEVPGSQTTGGYTTEPFIIFFGLSCFVLSFKISI